MIGTHLADILRHPTRALGVRHTAPEAEAGLIWDPSENASAMRHQKMQTSLKKAGFLTITLYRVRLQD